MGRSAPIREFQDSTRGRLLALLLEGPATVSDLAGELALTDNAVRAQLSRLQMDGYVRREGERRSGGRPAHVYGLAPRAQEAFPDGSPAVLAQLLDTLQDRMEPADLGRALSETGRRIAARMRADGAKTALPGVGEPASSTDGDDDESTDGERDADVAPLDAEQVLALLERLGGDPRMERRDGTLAITSPTCLLGPATRGSEDACEVGRSFLEELFDAPVKACCELEDGWPRCGFEVDLSGRET